MQCFYDDKGGSPKKMSDKEMHLRLTHFNSIIYFYIPWKHQKTLLCGASKGFMKAPLRPS